MNILFQVAPLTLLSPPQFSLQIQFSLLAPHHWGKLDILQETCLHLRERNPILMTQINVYIINRVSM